MIYDVFYKIVFFGFFRFETGDYVVNFFQTLLRCDTLYIRQQILKLMGLALTLQVYFTYFLNELTINNSCYTSTIT